MLENTDESFGYYSKTVSERLGIGKDTLRTWSLKLENVGVEFERNQRKQRIYYLKDIRMLQDMKNLMDLQQPLEETAKSISGKWEKGAYAAPVMGNNAEITPSVFQEKEEKNELVTPEKRMALLEENLVRKMQESQHEQLEKFKKDLANEMVTQMQDRFEEAIDQAVKMALLEERKVMAKEIAAELAATQEKTEKKSFWKRIFS